MNSVWAAADTILRLEKPGFFLFPGEWENRDTLNEWRASGPVEPSVKASFPDKTDEPFTLEYHYVLKDFSGGANEKFAVPLSPVTLPPVQDRDLDRKSPLWIGYSGEEEYESQIELPSGWSAAQPNALDLKESFAEFHGGTEVKGNMVVTKRQVIKASEVTPDQLASLRHFRKRFQIITRWPFFLHPTLEPASTPH